MGISHKDFLKNIGLLPLGLVWFSAFAFGQNQQFARVVLSENHSSQRSSIETHLSLSPSLLTGMQNIVWHGPGAASEEFQSAYVLPTSWADPQLQAQQRGLEASGELLHPRPAFQSPPTLLRDASAVWRIEIFSETPVDAGHFSAGATCSGFFVSPLGYFVTGLHCLTGPLVERGILARRFGRQIDESQGNPRVRSSWYEALHRDPRSEAVSRPLRVSLYHPSFQEAGFVTAKIVMIGKGWVEQFPGYDATTDRPFDSAQDIARMRDHSTDYVVLKLNLGEAFPLQEAPSLSVEQQALDHARQISRGEFMPNFKDNKQGTLLNEATGLEAYALGYPKFRISGLSIGWGTSLESYFQGTQANFLRVSSMIRSDFAQLGLESEVFNGQSGSLLAPSIEGMSGGPVLNQRGSAIGLTTRGTEFFSMVRCRWDSTFVNIQRPLNDLYNFDRKYDLRRFGFHSFDEIFPRSL